MGFVCNNHQIITFLLTRYPHLHMIEWVRGGKSETSESEGKKSLPSTQSLAILYQTLGVR